MASTDFDAEVQKAVDELAPALHQILSIMHQRLNVNTDGTPQINFAALSFVCQPLLGVMDVDGKPNGGFFIGPVMIATNMPNNVPDMHKLHIEMLRNAFQQVKRGQPTKN